MLHRHLWLGAAIALTGRRSGGSLALPVGLAFDADGSLWVVGGAGALTQFGMACLGATGAPMPTARLSVSAH